MRLSKHFEKMKRKRKGKKIEPLLSSSYIARHGADL